MKLRTVVVWALAGMTITVFVTLLVVGSTGRHPLNLVQPGRDGPSAEVIRSDFPGVELPPGIGHDGQQFYAIARAPMHLSDVADQLGDRPRYRLQRPLFPWLAWALHPAGGGRGLVAAMFAVGVAALVAGGVATGALARRVGLDERWAIAFPLLPGSYVALRISTADHLAAALLVGALTLALRDRWGWATAAAVGAVLAKEAMLAPLAGLLLWRRDRRTALLVGAPLLAAVAWMAIVHAAVPGGEPQAVELTWPLGGVVDSLDDWAAGRDVWAAGTLAASVALGVATVVRRGAADPLGGPTVALLVLSAFLFRDAIGLDLNSPRITAPLMLLGLLGAFAPRPGQGDGSLSRWRRQP